MYIAALVQYYHYITIEHVIIKVLLPNIINPSLSSTNVTRIHWVFKEFSDPIQTQHSDSVACFGLLPKANVSNVGISRVDSPNGNK